MFKFIVGSGKEFKLAIKMLSFFSETSFENIFFKLDIKINREIHKI